MLLRGSFHSRGTFLLILIRSDTKPRTGMEKVESVRFTAALLLAAGPPTSEGCGCTRRNVSRYQQLASTAPRPPQPQAGEAHRWHQRLVSHGQKLCTLRDHGANLIEQVIHRNRFVQPELPTWDASTPSLAPRWTRALFQAVGGPCDGDRSWKKFRRPSLEKALTSLQSTQWKTF